MSGGSASIHGQEPTKGNERTGKILLICKHKIGGRLKDLWKGEKGLSPKGEGSQRGSTKSCKQSYTFWLCFGKIRNFPLTRPLRRNWTGHLCTGPDMFLNKEGEEVKPSQVQASAVKHKMSLAMLLSKLHPLCKQPGHFCERPDVILLWQTWNMGTQHSHLHSGGSVAPCWALGGPIASTTIASKYHLPTKIPSSHKLSGLGGWRWCVVFGCC